MRVILNLKYVFTVMVPKKYQKYFLKKLFNKIKYDPSFPAMKIRCKVVGRLFKSFGEGSFIKDGVTIRGFDNIKIGENCGINKGCFFSVYGGIEIGDFVGIAHDCAFHTNSHIYSDPNIPIAKQGSNFKKIIIEDDVWIGCHTVVLQGVNIGKGSVIGANSLVNKDIPPFSIAVGSPVKIVGKRSR